jgi:hypothetical protein
MHKKKFHGNKPFSRSLVEIRKASSIFLKVSDLSANIDYDEEFETKIFKKLKIYQFSNH